MAQKLFQINRKSLGDVGWEGKVYTFGKLLQLTTFLPFVRNPNRFLQVRWTHILWEREGKIQAIISGYHEKGLLREGVAPAYTIPLDIRMAALTLGFMEVQIRSTVPLFDRTGRLVPWVTVSQRVPQPMKILLLDGGLNPRWHEEPAYVGLLCEKGNCPLPVWILNLWQRWTLRRLRERYEGLSCPD